MSSNNSSLRLDDPSSPPQVWNITKPWIDKSMILGEGPYYEPATHSIRWTDIYGKKIYWVDLVTGPPSLRSVDVKDPVGVTTDIHGDDENIFVAAKYGFGYVNKQTGELTYIQRIWEDEGKEKIERMRFNDGAVDSRGRFWAGSMTDMVGHKLKKDGAVFRLDASLTSEDTYSLTTVISPATIPNGIGWSPKEHNRLYYTDSPTRTIWQFDYDEETGTVSNKRPWFVLEGSIRIPSEQTSESELFTFDSSMVPDGFQFDEHGHLWTAIWGAGMVLRIEDRGTHRMVTGVVRIPATCSTCPRFVPGGGMVITSARKETPGQSEQEEPHGGKVFWVDVGVEGSETWKFRRPVNDERNANADSKL